MIRRCKNKKQSKIILIASVFLLFLIIFFIYVLWANTALSVDEFDFRTDKITLENDFKIAHLSDYHNSQSDKLTDDVLESLKENNPDIIVLTGDLVDNRRTDTERAISFIEKIIEIAPVYYVTGNHEYRVMKADENHYNEFIENIELLGVELLENTENTIALENDEIINIHGIVDPYFSSVTYSGADVVTDDFCSSLSVDANEFNILLAHHPEQLDVYAKYKFDLVFSGHAHGGQARFFNQGLIAPDQGLFPEFTNGKYKSGETTLIVSRGIGNSIIPIRLFNRPHLIYLNIKNNSLNQ